MNLEFLRELRVEHRIVSRPVSLGGGILVLVHCEVDFVRQVATLARQSVALAFTAS